MNSDATDEAQLARSFREGDEEALRLLFQRHAGALQARANRWLGARVRRRLSAADLLQEAWLVAFQRRQDFQDRGAGSLRAWLLGIVDLKAREALRRHDAAKRATDREVTRTERASTGAFPGNGPSPSAVAIAAERIARVRRAMHGLSEDYREVLQLGLEQGLPLREVAVRMNRSRDAVKKLYWRALCRLKEVCSGLEGEHDG